MEKQKSPAGFLFFQLHLFISYINAESDTVASRLPIQREVVSKVTHANAATQIQLTVC